MSAGHQVHVKVGNRLACLNPGIDNQAVTLPFEPQITPQANRQGHDFSPQLRIIHLTRRRNMAPRNDEDMIRRLGESIAKSQNGNILIKNFRRSFSPRNGTKKTILCIHLHVTVPRTHLPIVHGSGA